MSNTSSKPVIGFIGAGNMARSLAGGLLQNGWGPKQLLLADPSDAQRQLLQQALGLTVSSDNGEVAGQAEILVLAVKPQTLSAVAQGIAAAVQKRRPLVISIVAGVRIEDMQRWLGGNLPIVRVMPNTPALIGAGASGLYANEQVSTTQREQAEAILRAVGIAVWVKEESLIDAVTALSGSGPAYFFLMMEALESAALAVGLDAAQARLLTLETAFGAAKMALASKDDPATLRKQVTSPGGTTEQALKVMEDAGLRKIYGDAVAAAARRAHELGDLFGKNV